MISLLSRETLSSFLNSHRFTSADPQKQTDAALLRAG
jgi:hypothetical protein